MPVVAHGILGNGKNLVINEYQFRKYRRVCRARVFFIFIRE